MKPLTRKDVTEIEYSYLRNFIDKPMPEGGMVEVWYELITTFMQQHGYEIISPDIRKGEADVMERGLEREYFQALTDALRPPLGISETHLAVLLISASVEEREAALQYVLEHASKGGHR